MALTAAQIVNLANSNAKTPGMTTQAGQYLNVILDELTELHDMELARGLWTINTGVPVGYTSTSSIPYYNLATDHRRIEEDGVFYLVSGVPYTLIQKQLSEFDQLITTVGFNSQMVFYAVDDSQAPAQIYFWPPSNAAYTVNVRYIRQMPAISSPEASSTVPWFPLQQYLIWELAARMMDISDDERANMFHQRARDKLSQWLTQQRDMESTTLRVKLDRNRFSTPYSLLKNTKQVGF